MVDVRLLSDVSHKRIFSAGQQILPAGQDAHEFYIVVSGRVVCRKAEEGMAPFETADVMPGYAFGQQVFFAGESGWVFEAQQDTTVFVVTDKMFRYLVSAHPEIAFELLRQAYDGKEGAVRAEEPVQREEAVQGAKEQQGEETRECTPDNYNVENALKAREAFRQKFKKAGGVKQQEKKQAVYPPTLFPAGYQGYPNVTKPEYAQYLYPADYKCPNCGQEFEAAKVFVSKLVPAGAPRYDLRQQYKGFAMEWYEILTCPHCYFSMFEDFFTTPKTPSKQMINDALQTAKNEMPLDFGGERTLDFVFAAHFLALCCVEGYTGKKHLNMRIWSGISWLFEDAGDTALMQDYALKVAQVGEQIYSESKLAPAQEQMLGLSTAGMLHRAGKDENLMKWLFDVKTMKNGKKIYAELAENLMNEIREKQKQ